MKTPEKTIQEKFLERDRRSMSSGRNIVRKKKKDAAATSPRRSSMSDIPREAVDEWTPQRSEAKLNSII